MDKNQRDTTEQVLDLTIEIMILLTGEDYFVVKKPGMGATNNSLQQVEESWSAQTDVNIPLLPSVMHDPQNKQKILELTKKITELLTEEVPIRCQDVTVHFSMEEWEYLEGHEEIYKDMMMENCQTLISLGLPKNSPNEYPPMQIKEEQYGGNLTNPNIYTPKDHIQPNSSTHINKEQVSCDARNLIETTQQYPCTVIKEESVSSNGETLTNQNMYIPAGIHTQQYAYTYIKEEPSSSERPFKNHKNILLGQTQYLSTHIKEDLPTHVKEELVSCSGGNLICNAHYPATHPKEGSNLPETQSRANDNINIQFSCSECKKCFLSMAELVSHQGIHIAEKLLQSGTHVFTTAVVHAPQVPPVKHKLLTCSKCGRTFYTKSSLVGHMKTHWGKVNHLQNETFKCEQCGKCFSSKSLLHMHSRLHFGDRPYACSTCGERFMRTSDLGRHQRKHR